MGLFSFGADKTKCKECGTEFPDSEKLNKHREKAHKKNKEKCRICGTEFNYPDALRKHKKKCKVIK